MRIALFAREIEYRWRERLCFIIRALVDHGVDLIYYDDFYYKMLEKYRLDIPIGKTYKNNAELPLDIDIFLCLGGDGTFLESLTLIQDRGIPVAGINFGRLGFLTSADSEPSLSWIDDLLNKNFKIEKRILLEVSCEIIPPDFYPYSLNEVSVQRQDPSMLSVHVKINGMELPTYWSDGLVLASPTGSTAYSLSVGGPIVLPNSKALILAPIAPHNLNIRPLVVPEESVIEISVNSRKSGAILCLDNRSLPIANGITFTVKKAKFELNYISLKSSYFLDALKEKLLWGEDKRNS